MPEQLKIYNTLSQSKEVFKPLEPGKVKMYVCGNTVYDKCHLGHARSMVFFDVVARLLRHLGYDLQYVRNITDIEDKIIARSAELGISEKELTAKCIASMNADAAALNIIPPDKEPCATEYIPEMLSMIEKLMANGHAYVSGSGDVCYEVNSFKDYGKLSKQNVNSLLQGVRIAIDEGKKSPLDFVLWKLAKPAEPSWPAVFGAGRPGWAIECSAMSYAAFGEVFDIHGGGSDLQFPHHENEIAQTEACTAKNSVNYWMHVGMLQIDNEKMAKSTGKFITIEAALDSYHSDVIRYFLLSSHYRSPLQYSAENMQAAQKSVARLYQSLKLAEAVFADELKPHELTQFSQQFHEAMLDDFNTPIALSVLFDLAHELNRKPNASLALTLRALGKILGILQDEPRNFLQFGEHNFAEIEKDLAARNQARIDRDFKLADSIREKLLASGIEVEDLPNGTSIWRKT